MTAEIRVKFNGLKNFTVEFRNDSIDGISERGLELSWLKIIQRYKELKGLQVRAFRISDAANEKVIILEEERQARIYAVFQGKIEEKRAELMEESIAIVDSIIEEREDFVDDTLRKELLLTVQEKVDTLLSDVTTEEQLDKISTQ